MPRLSKHDGAIAQSIPIICSQVNTLNKTRYYYLIMLWLLIEQAIHVDCTSMICLFSFHQSS